MCRLFCSERLSCRKLRPMITVEICKDGHSSHAKLSLQGLHLLGGDHHLRWTAETALGAAESAGQARAAGGPRAAGAGRPARHAGTARTATLRES